MKSDEAQSGIIRVEKDHSHPYKLFNTAFANDDRLSWGARGVMAYLLSKPDDWRMLPRDLIRQSSAGRDAVYKILQNLEDCGYLRRDRHRRDDGTFSYTTVVYEHSRPYTAFPYTAEPYTAEPLTEKPYVLTSREELNKERNDVRAGVQERATGTVRERYDTATVPVSSRVAEADAAAVAVLDLIGLDPKQIKRVMAARPDFSADECAGLSPWLERLQSNPTIKSPVGIIYKTLVDGGKVPADRTNGHQSAEPIKQIVDDPELLRQYLEEQQRNPVNHATYR